MITPSLDVEITATSRFATRWIWKQLAAGRTLPLRPLPLSGPITPRAGVWKDARLVASSCG
ncbi:hypothetical protein LNQ03_03415 [Klebsiella pneumoniae subsp. pneumoniae]|nr:hypothetical protein [Klebsiella pneumoniae subsp. pneumoniae]